MSYNAPVNIVIAPQAFKGSLGVLDAARAMAEGVRRAAPQAETLLVPVADGGDGTLEALVGSKGRYFATAATGPLGEPIADAAWGVMPHQAIAVIEMARASGLALVPPERRDPRLATTHGTGELILSALEAGYRDIIVGLGGSATNDGGTGMARALGARFLDAARNTLPPGGAALARLDSIDLQGLDRRLKSTRLRGAADVLNPLCGPQGATRVYGPQKGATAEMLEELDGALLHSAQIIRRDLGIDILDLPGAGAAGGTGAGVVSLLGGQLLPGADLVCDAVGLDDYLARADLAFTGEGRLDGQTLYNKAPLVVTRQSKSRGVPVIAIAGSLGPGYEAVLEHGITGVEIASTPDLPETEALARAYDLVRDAAERAMRAYVAGQ